MKRRQFIAASMLAGASAAVPAMAQKQQQYYEFSKYKMLNNTAKGRFERFWEQAAIPALNRQGIQPVGLFRSQFGSHGLDYYVLIPHPSLESFASTWEKISTDSQYQTDAKPYSEPAMSDPLYYRYETGLLKAFSNMPVLELPDHIKGKPGRLFEVRIYESHNRDKARLKIEMFNQGGEIALFKETGLNPVMFGETLAGEKMPNLTYILGFADIEERNKAWDTFRNSSGWAVMKENPRYADTVSSVTDYILSPAGCSQI